MTQIPADRIMPLGKVIVRLPGPLRPGEHQEIDVPLEAIALP
jgi:hypothetical protein